MRIWSISLIYTTKVFQTKISKQYNINTNNIILKLEKSSYHAELLKCSGNTFTYSLLSYQGLMH